MFRRKPECTVKWVRKVIESLSVVGGLFFTANTPFAFRTRVMRNTHHLFSVVSLNKTTSFTEAMPVVL